MDNDDYRNNAPSWRRIIASFVDAYVDAQRAKAYKKPRDWAAIWTAGATVFIAIFTAVTIAVGVSQFHAMRDQQTIMKGQLDEMVAEQRPWVSVKVTGTASPLQRIGENLQIQLHYHLENVGKLPATRVFFYAVLVPAANAADFKDAIKNACNKFIGRMNSDINSAGVTLFPGQTADSDFGTDETPASDFIYSGTVRPAMLVAVCTVYRFKGDGGQFHYTPAAYILVTFDATGPTNIDASQIPDSGLGVQIRSLAQGNLEPT